jgi:hypothetical protein
MKKATIRTLVAAATASLALVAAGPANAEQKESGSDSDKYSCEVEYGDGSTGWVSHGTKMKIYLGTDSQGNAQYQHLVCNDGNWEEVAQLFPSRLTFQANLGVLTAAP